MVSYSEIIEKPIDIVWEHFIYKVDYPQYFVPGVSNVLIKEKNESFTVREMDITSPEGVTHRVIEKITYAPYHVVFNIIDHPLYRGHVDNFAEKISDTQTKITFCLNWIDKKTGDSFNNESIAKHAVLKTIDYILKAK